MAKIDVKLEKEEEKKNQCDVIYVRAPKDERIIISIVQKMKLKISLYSLNIR